MRYRFTARITLTGTYNIVNQGDLDTVLAWLRDILEDEIDNATFPVDSFEKVIEIKAEAEQ